MTNSRPKYISFDIYGTLINWNTDSTTRRLLAGRLPEEQWPAFKKVFRGYRFDEVLATTSRTSRSSRIPSTGSASSSAFGRPPVQEQSWPKPYATLVPTTTYRPR